MQTIIIFQENIMNHPIKIALVVLLLLLLFGNVSGEGIVKKGQVGFRFLENPVSAEAIGRGGMGLITIYNANTVFWNPAGLGWIPGKYDVSLNYTKGIADIDHNAIAAAFQIGRFGVIGLDVLMMNYGDFYGTRRANNDQGFVDTGTFSPQAYAIGLSFSQKVSDRFSYGVRIKYARQDLGSAWIGVAGIDVDDPALEIEEKSYALAEPSVDIGAIYDFLYHKIRFGAVIQNFSREIKYEDEKFPLPFAVSFGITVDPLSFFSPFEDGSPFLLGFETRHPRDFKEKFKVGAEYVYDNMLIIRSGYMGNYDERGLTMGFGFTRSYMNSKFRLDYAYEDFGIFDAAHTFSFGVTY